MPLFKKNHKHDNEVNNTSSVDSGLRTDPSMARTGAGAGANDARMNHPQHGNLGTQELSGGYAQNTAMGHTGGAPQAGTGTGMGMAGQAGMTGGLDGGVPPTQHYGAPDGQRHGASRTAGKVEHAVGALVGSNALKTRGLEKEQEANAIKAQSAELAEAERLEREAMLRRERAVAHGAHPENRHLGGPGHTAFPGQPGSGM